jgi:prepilin peptidase CpaA
VSLVTTQWVGAFALAAVACWTDVRTRRIPNWLTFPAALLGVAMATVAHGGQGAIASGLGLLVGLLLFFPLFALKGLGAGDVKLLGALGAWLGASLVLAVAFYTSLAGGLLAIGLMVKHRYGGQAFRNLWLLFTHWRVSGLRPLDHLTIETAAGPKLPYALPTAVGLALAFWLW